jgi:hypothetical protein
MAEYIEREALLLRIDCYGTNKFGMLDEDIRAFVKAQPAADVAPVVRCKDCKHAYINSLAVSSGEALCTLSGKPMQQDDFCSYGEPKEG